MSYKKKLTFFLLSSLDTRANTTNYKELVFYWIKQEVLKKDCTQKNLIQIIQKAFLDHSKSLGHDVYEAFIVKQQQQHYSFFNSICPQLLNHLCEMSSCLVVFRIAIIIKLLLPVEPLNSVTAILLGSVNRQVQIPGILGTVMKFVVFCQILYPVFRFFL